MKKLSIFLAITLALVGCEKSTKVAKQQVAPKVGVMEVAPQKIKKSSKFLGRVEPLARVKVRGQTQGIIIAKHFSEGQKVKKGDLLFEIDPLPYEATLLQQESLLKQAESALSLAKVKFAMARSLAGKNVLTDLDQEQVKVDRDVAEAAVATSKANVENARIQLQRTKIYAPIDGVTGEFKKNVGDLVGLLGVSGVVDIIANDHIQVYGQLDEKTHFKFSQRKNSENFVPDTLEIELPDGTKYDYTGKLNYIGADVSKTTGTITYRVVFPNPEGYLLGGQNVNIIVTRKAETETILIPQSSVQEDQIGRYVFTLNADNVVQKTYVTLGGRVGTNWEVVKGLNTADKLIVTGLLKAKPGRNVTPVFEEGSK